MLAALIVAVIVFYTVRSKISHTTTLAVPVESEKEPGLAVLAVDPFAVRVTFRGAYTDLQQLSARDLRVRLRPHATASGGSERVRVRARDVHGRSAGVRVVGIEPDTVTLAFDRQDEMTLPLAEPPIEGHPLRGRVELEYAPRQVSVKGARGQLQELKAADYHMQTEPINVVGCLQSFTKMVRIVPPGATWQTEITPAEVTVKVNIITEQSTRELRDLPVLVTTPAGRKGMWQVEPPTVQVRLTGRVEVVQSVAPESLVVTVDARRASSDEPMMLPVLIHRSADLPLDAVESDPPSVLVFRSDE